MSEADLRAAIKTRAESWGWRLLGDFSDHRRMPAGLTGIPDLLFAVPAGRRSAHAAIVFVEAKSENGKRNAAQLEWFDGLRPFLGPNLRYIVTDHPWDFEAQAAQSGLVERTRHA